MSYNFYSIIHLMSILVFALSLGGLWGLYASPKKPSSTRVQSFLLSLHGLSSFVIFVAGFGLIAKLKIPWPWPWWIYAKLLVWLLLSLSPFIIRITHATKNQKLYILLWMFLMMMFLLPVFVVRFKTI